MNGNQSSDPKRMIVAVGLSTAIILGWSLLFPQKKPPKHPAPAVASASASTGASAGASSAPGSTANGPAAPSAASGATGVHDAPVAPAGDAFAHFTEQTAALEAPGQQRVSISNRDGQVAAWDLLEAQYAMDDPAGFHLVVPPAAEVPHGVFLPPMVDLTVAGQPLVGVYQVSAAGDAVTAHLDDAARGITVDRIYTRGEAVHSLNVTVTVSNRGPSEVSYGLSARLRGAQNNVEASGKFGAQSTMVFEGLCARAEKTVREGAAGIVKKRASAEDLPRFTDGLRYGAVDTKYFITALMPGVEGLSACELFTGTEAAGIDSAVAAQNTTYVTAKLDLPGGTVASGKSVTRSFQLFGGPKKLEILTAQTPSLGDSVDYGMWSPLCLPMLATLRWFYGIVPNFGVAIVLLTLLVKLLTFPLTQKQYKSMAAMRAIQPQLKALQEKYKEDRVRLQSEMMALYKANGVNPLAGCLPVLMMMPVYISLYRTIGQAVELYHAELGLWIHDLSAQDPYYILPIVLGGLFVFQTRLNPPAGDPVQQKLMTWFMPIFFTAMMLFLPAGLVVYILCNTMLGIVQQSYMNKRVAPPTPPNAPAAARGRS